MSSHPRVRQWSGVKLVPFVWVLIVGFILWNVPIPGGLTPQTWRLFTIFVSTIVGIVTSPLPMGATALIGLVVAVTADVLSMDQALSKFSSPTVWLTVSAFLIARAFIKSTLGDRLAYLFIALLGKNYLGLGYGVVLTEFFLAPVIPSNTARGGGITYPIIQPLALNFQSQPDASTRRRIGAYLIQVGYHANVVTSAMFLTAMAGNPLMVEFAKSAGIDITWMLWFQAAIVPGIISLICIPLILAFIYPPDLRDTPQAPEQARQRLKEMGSLNFAQGIMLGIFCFLITLWILGEYIGVDATTTALLGLSILLLVGVLQWEDILNEKGAWNTLIWFSVLLTMAEYLDKFGMMKWLGGQAQITVAFLPQTLAIAALLGFYFYIHYFFASITAHVSAFYATFLLVILASGLPPVASALILAFFSCLSGCLTHYGSGSAAAFFGSRYVTVTEWWKNGFVMSLAHIVVWGVVGSVWWRYLGIL
ncbi:MAG: DASS family sodium-coupled anion symporter [Alphaproteobacteria bacterium]|nr:MAG: DASS family sodium-coupled anion symporter [Alphaproteobacteria bacterium]